MSGPDLDQTSRVAVRAAAGARAPQVRVRGAQPGRDPAEGLRPARHRRPVLHDADRHHGLVWSAGPPADAPDSRAARRAEPGAAVGARRGRAGRARRNPDATGRVRAHRQDPDEEADVPVVAARVRLRDRVGGRLPISRRRLRRRGGQRVGGAAHRADRAGVQALHDHLARLRADGVVCRLGGGVRSSRRKESTSRSRRRRWPASSRCCQG